MTETIAWADLNLPEAHALLALREACPDARPQRFSDGDLIVDSADPTRDCVLLVRGSCLVEAPGSVAMRKPGSEIAIVEATPEAPVFLGEMASLVDGTERVASVRSAMNTWGIRLSPHDLAIVMERFPRLTQVLCRALSERLREVSLHLRQFRHDHALGFTHVFLNPGEELYAPDAPASTLWQIVQGSVTLRWPDWTETVTAQGDKPCFLELSAYLRNRPYAGHATAATAVMALCLPDTARLAVVRNFPALVLDTLTA